MTALRRPLAALLRRSHDRHRAPATPMPPARPVHERITCRPHGLTRCDHCPAYRVGVATRTALMTPTRVMPTVEGRR